MKKLIGTLMDTIAVLGLLYVAFRLIYAIINIVRG